MLSVKRKFIQAPSLFFLTLFLIGVAHPVEAAVYINEIAWMGGDTSGTHEWIELTNDTDTPMPLLGWHLTAADGSPNITLSGTIAAHGYYLIERKTDAAVPAISADLVASFGVGLANTGETLELKNASDTVIDVVIGGKEWVNIGGDNSTKETAQRREGARGWVTGTPTPRAQNIHPKETRAPALTAPQSTREKPVTKQPIATSVEGKSASGTTTVLWKGGVASTGASGFPSGRNMEWFFLFFGIALSAFAAFLILRSREEEPLPADAYSIVEDIIESADD
jgi:hypothetical protein